MTSSLKLIEVEAREIFAKTKIPEASYVVNQYVGCGHSCLYCYAKFMCRWKRYGEWGSWVEAKVNAPELIKNRYVHGVVYMSSVSDPYQPIERELKLTRRVLENMDENICLRILTKSNLILRDIDVLMKFKHLEVGLTVNGFNEEIKKVFEPNSPRHEDRVKALKELSRRGLKTYAFISPAIPHLVDVTFLVQQLKDIVDFFIVEPLNIKLCGKRFFKALKELAPNSFNSINSLDKYLSYHRKLRRELQELKVKAMLVAHYPRLCVYKL
ncbi:MAG: radical SAM protein [Candidatus Methanomethylicota archaeon]|uniref:Radical SAM protein n=1 Tax=Thermoproteota archaeon TaxID=2056631 RepID=A0A497ETI3_9CREN|nr:MAG: radical SAM protein [Candidatus Verstraetearchaeota archaeon]